jgi:hypothetical protein
LIPLYTQIPWQLCSHLTVDEGGYRRCLVCGLAYYRRGVLEQLQAAMRKRSAEIWRRMHTLEREEIE